MAAAAVCSLHALLILMLLARPVRITTLRESPAMEITYLPRTGVTPVGVPQAPTRDVRRSLTMSGPAGPQSRAATLELLRDPAGKSPAAPASGPQAPPAIDWAGEIEKEAARTADSQSRAFKEFGFPRSAAPASAQASEFAWDHAHTHRVETLPEGGVLINLSDRCVLVLMPFPFPFCGIGTKPANGELFKDVKRPRD